MPYGFYAFERYDFAELAHDLDGVLSDVEPAAIVSLTHSTVLDGDNRVRYSALVVLHSGVARGS